MKQQFEAGIRAALDACSRDVQPSDALLPEIHREYRKRKEKDEMKMGMKKMIAIAAALCLVCASCFAAVQLASVETGSSKDILNYADLAGAAAEIGIEAKYVQRFANGLEFQAAGIASSHAIDAQGNMLDGEYPGLNIGYTDAAGHHAALFIEAKNPYEENGMPFSEGYSSNTYKFVPGDYERTDEDRAREAEGGFFISFGNEEVEEQQVENYSWKDGGLYYSLTAFGCSFGEAGMVQMVQEIMG